MGASSSTASNASTTTTKTTTTIGQQPSTRPLEKSTPKGKPVQHLTKYGCWNIRRGLIKHDTEIKQLLNEEKISIMFLVETDNKMIRTPEEYKLEGFVTILQKSVSRMKS
jgi:hypothetical protein